jgi:hypothetical protein
MHNFGDLNLWTFILQAGGLVVLVITIRYAKSSVDHTRETLNQTAHQFAWQRDQSVAERYQRIVAELPVDALLNRVVEREVIKERMSWFYLYFDLCNEQAWSKIKGRIDPATWEEWRDGIESNLARPAFQGAWQLMLPDIGSDFSELRAEFREVLSPPGGTVR